ncbi:MAG TPA: hypothetical protein VHS28_05845, partial [Chloroflexota bacterium]|nr:hypothetical protein [Chloroflexota bacterium]
MRSKAAFRPAKLPPQYQDRRLHRVCLHCLYGARPRLWAKPSGDALRIQLIQHLTGVVNREGHLL